VVRRNACRPDFRYWPKADPRDLRAASPLTEVHRPRARQAVDVVGAPAYDPLRKSGGCAHTCRQGEFFA